MARSIADELEIVALALEKRLPFGDNPANIPVRPEYPVLDAILEGLIEREESVASLIQSGKFPAESVRWVATRLDRNEFKRRQMPPGIKLTARAFGSGRRMPMAAKFD